MVYELEKEHKKSSLMCKKKEELAKEIMRLEHNVNVMNERLGNQANAIKRYEQESRAKAIDEFAEKLNTDVESFEAEVNGIRADLLTLDYFSEFVFDVAEQMKGEQNE